jgi:hypothetical protein
MNAFRLVSVPFVIAATAMASAAEVDVYLLGGQSNMQGIGKLADLPADVPREPTDTFFWNGKAFEPLIVGTTRTSNRPDEFGPEIGLATTLPANGRRHDLVKYAASGMPLHHGWNAATWVGDPPGPKRRSFYPGERPADPNQGTLYREMLIRFRAAIAAVKERGDTPAIRGFAWMQGEADAKHERSATDYAASLRRLRDRLATDLGVDALPLVFGQVLPHEPAMARFTHRREIRDAMAAADERSGRPEAVPLARMVSTEGFGLLSDTVHYDAAGQLALGRAFAAALQSIDALPKRR